MKYTTRTEYGLVCMVYLAKNHAASRTTIRELAEKEHYPIAYLEKILQSLRQAKLVDAIHGNQGGYVLARPASEITLRDIIEALEGSTFEVFCAPGVREDIVCNHICLCGMKPVWHKTKDVLDHFYGGITLEMLVQPQAAVQSRMAKERV